MQSILSATSKVPIGFHSLNTFLKFKLHSVFWVSSQSFNDKPLQNQKEKHILPAWNGTKYALPLQKGGMRLSKEMLDQSKTENHQGKH